MMDQRAKFSPKGIMTEFVEEDQHDDNAIKRVTKGDVQLLFISPESLITNAVYRNMLLSPIYKESLVALVVHEAHCIKTW